MRIPGSNVSPFFFFVDSQTYSLHAETWRWWKSYERFDKFSTCHTHLEGGTHGSCLTDAFHLQCLDTGKDFVFPKNYTGSVISVGFGEALLRLLESLTEPVIPTALNAACGQATSKDQGFEVSKVPLPFGSGHPEPNEGGARSTHHSVMLVAYSNHWRPTAVRQVSTCFRERTSELFPYVAI